MRNANTLTNVQKIQFWQKLNRKPLATYIRFQKIFAKHNKGKWIRGCSISESGIVSFNLN